jgi:dephospho-CoA kinase
MKRAARVGVTGKIASGKSTLARMMRAEGFDIIDTDSLAKELMLSDAALKKSIVQLLGPSAYTAKGLDRAFVAREVFGNEPTLRALEALVHPAVTAELEKRFAAASPGSIVGAESALILQSNLGRLFDYIVLVESSDEDVLARLQRVGKISEDDARKRLADQAYNSVRKENVDITLQNSGSEQEFGKRARGAIDLLKLLSGRDLPDVALHAITEEEEEEDIPESPEFS